MYISRVIYKAIIFIYLFLCSNYVIAALFLNNSVVDELDAYVNLIADVTHFYTAGSIYIVHDDAKKNFAVNAILFNLLKRFSAKKILSQAMRQSDLFTKYNSLFLGNKRQLIVLLLTNEEALKNFEEFTKTHLLSSHVWFVVFWTKRESTLHDYCERPRGNRFHLNFDTRMLVKCYNDPIIREWYALGPTEEVKVDEVLEWSPEKYLVEKSKRSFFQRRHDFNGKLLKVTTVKELTDIANATKNDNEETIDLVEKFMTELMLHMNFNISFLHSSPSYGLYNQSEGRWTGVLGNLSTGDVDISFTDTTLTPHRQQSFDFTWPLFMTPSVLYIKTPEKSAVRWNAYSKAFDYKIWISILIVMMIASITITIIKATMKNAYWIANHFVENQLCVWGIFCQQGLPVFPESSSLKIAYVSLFFCAILISAAYSGSIVSNLTNMSPPLPFSSFEEFVKLGTYKLAVMKNSYDHEYFAYTLDPLIRRVKKMIIHEEDLPANNVEGFEQMCHEKVAFYTNEAKKNTVVKSIPCKFSGILTGGHRFQSIPLAKNNPLTSFVNHHIRKFADYGLMKRTKNQYPDKNDYSRKKYDAVGLGEIAPLLTILMFGLIISIFALIFECISCRTCRLKSYTLASCVNSKIETRR